MDIGSIFLILGLLILVGLFISRPFFERRRSLVDQEEHIFSALLAERDRLLNALQELDFDNSLGKIPEGEYPAQRQMLLQRGADVLRQIDALGAGPVSDDLEARIEATVAARRADGVLVAAAANGISPQMPSQPDDDLEALIANRRRERNGKSGGFCPQCGKPVQKTDRFCPKCGTTLA